LFQLIKCGDDIFGTVTTMLDELGEAPQMLTRDSPRPLVVHRVMGQITLVLSGDGLARLAGRTVALAPGDLVILTPGCEHSFAAVGGDLQLRHWHWPQALLHEDRIILQDNVDLGPVDPAEPESHGGQS
jgi:mannose-6-phosphate isomerase-like protein (cupin superfamily)